GALAKSDLGNSRVSKVSGTLSTRLIKVTAVCRTYEICENGIWKKKKAYSEEREIVDYSDTITFEAHAAGYDHWGKHLTDPSTGGFDIDRAEKYLMTKLLEKLKKNEVAYGKFKENCK
ncbi:MAG: hypothetical protein OEQ28_15115, partial [Acidobacteriota bacterium]|nr:hypothetical protein [Acidobacteriota bacterium]